MGAVLLGIFIPCFIQPVAAQENRGTVAGVVTDPTHAVVPGAKVTLRNINTNVEGVLETDSGGFYRFDFVIPGIYRVTVEAVGFRKYVQGNVTVQTTGDVTVNVALALGALSQTVEVNAAVTQVEFNTSTMIPVTISSTDLKSLPLLGMSPITMAMLDPAVVNEYWDVNHHYAYYLWSDTQLDIGGHTSSKNALYIDGLNVNIGGHGTYTPSMDDVQEISVVENPTDSGYGFSGGPALNMSTKSGTNAFHGTAYYFGRNPDTDAMANRIDRSPPVFRQNSVGGTLGNPIVKNKLFNFFGYEYWTSTTPSSRTQTQPTDAEKAGDFSGALTPQGTMRVIYDPTTTVFNPVTNTVTRTPFSCNGAANVICPSRIDPTMAVLMPYIWGPNRTPDSPDGLNNMEVTYAEWNHYWNLTDRADYNISDKWRFFGRISKLQTTTDNDNWSPNHSIAVPSDGGGLAWGLNYGVDLLYVANPHTTLDFRAGHTSMVAQYQSKEYAVPESLWASFWPNNPWYSTILNPLQTEGGIYFPPFYFQGIGFTNTGTGGWYGQRSDSVNPEVNLTHEVGKHHLKVGWQLRYSYDQDLIPPVGPGYMYFNSIDTGSTFLSSYNPAQSGDEWASGLLGVINTGDTEISPRVDLHQQQWSFYAQDDLKLGSRITLNLGLRWERETAPADSQRRLIRTFDTTMAIPQLQGMTIWGPQQLAVLPANALSLQNMIYSFDGGMIRTTNSDPRMYDAPWKTFLPRVGIAIRLDNKTALRMNYTRFAIPWIIAHSDADNMPVDGFSETTNMLSPLEGIPRTYASNPFPTTGLNYNPILEPVGTGEDPYVDLGNPINWFWNGNQMKTPMNDRFSFTLERQEPARFFVQASFFMMFEHNLQDVGGGNAANSWNINQMNPMLNYTYKGLMTENVPNPFYNLLPANIMPGQLRTEPTVPLSNLEIPYPQYGPIWQWGMPGYKDHYYEVILSAKRPMFRGYTFLAAYNYNHDAASNYFNDIANYNKQLSLFDRGFARHNFRAAGTFELPFGKGRQFLGNAPRAVDAVVGGWSTSHIFWWRSGDLDMFGAAQLTCDPTQSIPSGSWFNGSCFQYLPAYTIRTNPWYYPSLRGPRYWDVDSTLVKSFKVTEKLSLEFRAEFYNLFNSFMPSDPDTTPEDGTTGRSVSVANNNYGRSMQYMVHFRW